jgi:hypothetical protein
MRRLKWVFENRRGGTSDLGIDPLKYHKALSMELQGEE